MPTTATAAAAIAITPATPALTSYPPEGRLKKTGYEALLLARFFSPGTLPISTLTRAFAPNADVGRLRFPKEIEVVSLGAIDWTTCFFVSTVLPKTVTVSVTGTCDSWKWPA